jgi:hypothetical protein
MVLPVLGLEARVERMHHTVHPLGCKALYAHSAGGKGLCSYDNPFLLRFLFSVFRSSGRDSGICYTHLPEEYLGTLVHYDLGSSVHRSLVHRSSFLVS